MAKIKQFMNQRPGVLDINLYDKDVRYLYSVFLRFPPPK